LGPSSFVEAEAVYYSGCRALENGKGTQASIA
jgi:hypothetical protein